jgi:phosphatidylglycerophosphate synthase
MEDARTQPGTPECASDDGTPWKLLVEEPTNRFVYYPLARRLVGPLVRTPITANQVTLVQPLIAAVAAVLIAFDDWRYLVVGALVFELRSLLDCLDGTLARAKNQVSKGGHALDALCDWASVVLLYGGIFVHFLRYPPPAGAWSDYLPMSAVMALSLSQGALRSFAADYYMRKYGSILDAGRDDTVEQLREMQRNLSPTSRFTERAEAWIGRFGHWWFQHEFFDVERTRSITIAQAELFRAQRHTWLTRFVRTLWSVSNGDFFIRLTVLSLFFGHRWMWELQLFWASVGVVWIFGVMWLNGWYLRRAIGGLEEEPSAASASLR